MKKLILLLLGLFLFCSPVVNVVQAQTWETNIRVDGDLPAGTDVALFQSQVENAINTSIDNAVYVFDIRVRANQDTTIYQCKVDIQGNVKAGTVLKDFGVTVYNYFKGKFSSAKLSVRYLNDTEW